jgi:3-oxoacyl-[acyl-carrier protein] reductase
MVDRIPGEVTMPVLDGKAAVVTGGSRGIGRAIVARLVADGATVVFTYHQDERAAEQLAAESGRAIPVRADLGVPEDLQRLFDEVGKRLDGLDILVNNAATGTVKPIAETTEEEYDRTMAVNTKAVFLTMQYAARHMRDGGRIVNLSTANTAGSFPGVGVYGASKAAVEQFTRVAARELGSRGITVNAVSPGATDTDLLRSVNTQEGLDFAVRLTPLGRLGQPADIADVVAFLVGPDGRWVTGQNLVVSGGLA